MVNTTEFIQRLQKVTQYYGLSSSGFADKIGVQRSSISHILSGRNKPSLEFVMKVLSSFPEVDLYWLLNGKGEFPSVDKIPSEFDSSSFTNKLPVESSENDEIDRIIIFYKDGSFKSYNN